MDPSYRIAQVETLDTPALVFYEEKIRENIARMGKLLDGFSRLRPHIKTHKCREILGLQIEAGIERFKCATIKEAHLAAGAGAREVLIAYPIIGPMADRVAALRREHPLTRMDVLADDPAQLADLSRACQREGVELGVMVDVNPGMNRTGVRSAAEAAKLARTVQECPGLRFTGLHTYGFPPTQGSAQERESHYREALQVAVSIRRTLESEGIPVPRLTAGGSPDCFVAAEMHGVDEVSPGTWILWDTGYEKLMPGRFAFAALVVGRVISRPTPALFAVDAGYKSVSADPAIPHAEVLSVPGSEVVGRWEEHLLVRLPELSPEPSVGTPVYIAPVHVCSTVNLWDEALVVGGQGGVVGRWHIAARGH